MTLNNMLKIFAQVIETESYDLTKNTELLQALEQIICREVNARLHNEDCNDCIQECNIHFLTNQYKIFPKIIQNICSPVKAEKYDNAPPEKQFFYQLRTAVANKTKDFIKKRIRQTRHECNPDIVDDEGNKINALDNIPSNSPDLETSLLENDEKTKWKEVAHRYHLKAIQNGEWYVLFKSFGITRKTFGYSIVKTQSSKQYEVKLSADSKVMVNDKNRSRHISARGQITINFNDFAEILSKELKTQLNKPDYDQYYKALHARASTKNLIELENLFIKSDTYFRKIRNKVKSDKICQENFESILQ